MSPRSSLFSRYAVLQSLLEPPRPYLPATQPLRLGGSVTLRALVFLEPRRASVSLAEAGVTAILGSNAAQARLASELDSIVPFLEHHSIHRRRVGVHNKITGHRTYA